MAAKGKGLIKNIKRLGVVAINVDEGDIDISVEHLRKEEGMMNVYIDSVVRKLPFFRGGDHGDGVEEEDDHEEEEHGRKLAEEETPYGNAHLPFLLSPRPHRRLIHLCVLRAPPRVAIVVTPFSHRW